MILLLALVCVVWLVLFGLLLLVVACLFTWAYADCRSLLTCLFLCLGTCGSWLFLLLCFVLFCCFRGFVLPVLFLLHGFVVWCCFS